VNFKQANGNLSVIPSTCYGELLVNPSLQMRGIFANQADAAADLVNCPGGSSVQAGSVIGSQPGSGTGHTFLMGGTTNVTLNNTQYAALQRSNSAFVAMFPTLNEANTWVAGQALLGHSYMEATGTISG